MRTKFLSRRGKTAGGPGPEVQAFPRRNQRGGTSRDLPPGQGQVRGIGHAPTPKEPSVLDPGPPGEGGNPSL